MARDDKLHQLFAKVYFLGLFQELFNDWRTPVCSYVIDGFPHHNDAQPVWRYSCANTRFARQWNSKLSRPPGSAAWAAVAIKAAVLTSPKVAEADISWKSETIQALRSLRAGIATAAVRGFMEETGERPGLCRPMLPAASSRSARVRCLRR